VKLKSIKITVVMEDDTKYSKPKERHKMEAVRLGTSGYETAYYPPDSEGGGAKQHMSSSEAVDCLAEWIKNVITFDEAEPDAD
jgi:hypothetical protein